VAADDEFRVLTKTMQSMDSFLEDCIHGQVEPDVPIGLCSGSREAFGEYTKRLRVPLCNQSVEDNGLH
jgi:hypothetical protein